jgi:type II secretory pathway predicted ATPase ExeA
MSTKPSLGPKSAPLRSHEAFKAIKMNSQGGAWPREFNQIAYNGLSLLIEENTWFVWARG